jgi:hypothetical protein
MIPPPEKNENGNSDELGIITTTTTITGERNSSSSNSSITELSIPLIFKTVLDIKVFGEVNTIELSCPVTISGTFDIHDTVAGLLTNVELVFNTEHLLRSMIDHARLVVKLAVTKAAATSVNVIQLYNAKREPKTKSTLPISKKTTTTATSTMSLNSLTTNSLFGSSVLLDTMTSLDPKALGSLFSSFSQQHQLQKRSGSTVAVDKGESNYGLLKNNTSTIQTIRKNSNSISPTTSTANATFDLKNDTTTTTAINSRNITSTVRFQTSKSPSPSTSPITCNLTTCNEDHVSSTSTCTTHPLLVQQAHSHHQQQLVPIQPQSQCQQSRDGGETSNGNVHAGLFSWLQNDSMFLTDNQIEEANVADAKREIARSLVPMPLRFFTANTDIGDLRYQE